MKNKFLVIFVIGTAFLCGFATNSILTSNNKMYSMKKVTGIGGIFFKCQDPDKMKEWYQKHLGINTNRYGAVFEWYQGADSTKKGFTTWSPFNDKTKYFEPSSKDFMINYRIEKEWRYRFGFY
jgi:hypothetical protein